MSIAATIVLLTVAWMVELCGVVLDSGWTVAGAVAATGLIVAAWFAWGYDE